MLRFVCMKDWLKVRVAKVRGVSQAHTDAKSHKDSRTVVIAVVH